MHNMSEYHKYGKDGIAKGLADKKRNPDKKEKELGHNYVQLMSNIEKLERKFSHVSGGKKWNHDRYESDSSSNSE